MSLTQLISTPVDNIIIANGNFPNNQTILNWVINAKQIICCDGGIQHLRQLAKKPNYIIGDLDSIDHQSLNDYQDLIIERVEQNSNDLSKAIVFARDTLKLDKVVIIGATGLREDHTLGNLAIMAKYSTDFDNLLIIDDYGIFSTHTSSCKIATTVGGQISFFTLNQHTAVTCQELKWPLHNKKFNYWFEGTLNQALTDYIKLHSTNTTIVYRAI